MNEWNVIAGGRRDREYPYLSKRRSPNQSEERDLDIEGSKSPFRLCDSTGSYVLASSWSGDNTESGCGLGSSGERSEGGADAAEHERGMCNRCREEDVMSKEEERIVAVHRKREWVWARGAQRGAGGDPVAGASLTTKPSPQKAGEACLSCTSPPVQGR